VLMQAMCPAAAASKVGASIPCLLVPPRPSAGQQHSKRRDPIREDTRGGRMHGRSQPANVGVLLTQGRAHPSPQDKALRRASHRLEGGPAGAAGGCWNERRERASAPYRAGQGFGQGAGYEFRCAPLGRPPPRQLKGPLCVQAARGGRGRLAHARAATRAVCKEGATVAGKAGSVRSGLVTSPAASRKEAQGWL
jgi:hypothetical protein